MHISYGMLAIEAVVKMTVVKQAPMHSGVETGKHINVAVTDHKRTAAIKREAFAKVVQRVGGGFGREMECAVMNVNSSSNPHFSSKRRGKPSECV